MSSRLPTEPTEPTVAAEVAAAAGLLLTGSASALAGSGRAGVAAMTVLSLAIEVTAGDFMARGKVTADSFDPPEPDPAEPEPEPAEPASEPPLSLAGGGHFGLVVRAPDRRVADADGGVEPDPDDLLEVEDSDRFLSPGSAASVEPGEEPAAAAATVGSEESLLPSGVSPFLLSDSGLSSTLFRTTVSG